MTDPAKPDIGAAQRHLRVLTGKPNSVVAWQTFDDLKSRSDRKLIGSFHDRISSALPRLVRAQQHGAGVYVAVNETDGDGRRERNMRNARAAFLDLDNAPLPASWPAEPGLVTNSSPGKHQVWWALQPTDDWATWRAFLKALIQRYGGDPKCALATQVGRLAGFWHLKRPDHPHQVRIVHEGPLHRWALPDLADAFGFDLSTAVQEERAAPVEMAPPPTGWDNDIDVAVARTLVADQDRWKPTSDGAVSVFQMACLLRDLGISPGLAVELIEEHVPALPPAANDDSRYVERKVQHAYRYAQNPVAGAHSYEADRRAFRDEVQRRLREGGE